MSRTPEIFVEKTALSSRSGSARWGLDEGTCFLLLYVILQRIFHADLTSSLHRIDHFLMCSLVLLGFRQGSNTPQIPNDILRLAEIYLLQQIPYLELHLLDHLSNVGNMRRIVLNGHILFNLPSHVTTEVHLAQVFVASR